MKKNENRKLLRVIAVNDCRLASPPIDNINLREFHVHEIHFLAMNGQMFSFGKVNIYRMLCVCFARTFYFDEVKRSCHVTTRALNRYFRPPFFSAASSIPAVIK